MGKDQGIVVAAIAGIALVVVLVLATLKNAFKPLQDTAEKLGDTASAAAGVAKNTAQAAEFSSVFINPGSYAATGGKTLPELSQTYKPALAEIILNVKKVTDKTEVKMVGILPTLVHVREWNGYAEMSDKTSAYRVEIHALAESTIIQNATGAKGGVIAYTDPNGNFQIRSQFPEGIQAGGSTALQVWGTKAGYNESTRTRLN